MKDKFKGKTTLKEMATNWAEVYGEDLANDYGGFYDELYEKYGEKTPFDLEEADDAWISSYGESLQDEYEGFWTTIGGKLALDYDEESGVFFDRDGNEFENPDDEEYMVYHDKGKGHKEKMSPSEFKKLMTAPKAPAAPMAETKPAMKPEAKPSITPKGKLYEDIGDMLAPQDPPIKKGKK